MRLLFIHGRSQEGKDPASIKGEWLTPLAGGLGASGLKLPMDEVSIEMPYYGDKLFYLAENLDQTEKTAMAMGGPSSKAMLEFEAEALTDIARAAEVPESAIQQHFDEETHAMGVENSRWVLAIARAVDGWNGGISAQAIRLLLRDVYVYITRSGVRDAVDEIVRRAIDEEPTVIVAHSLGTVVAYNVLRSDPRALSVPLLITVGSPLGINAVRRQLVPLKAAKVGYWLNVYDKRDIVALNPLETHFNVKPTVVKDEIVQNVTDNHHGISGYLNNEIVAKGIFKALNG